MLKDSVKIGLFFKLHFRALPRIGAFSARDLRLNGKKLRTLSIIVENLKKICWVFSEIFHSENDTLKIRKSSISQTGKWRKHKKLFLSKLDQYTPSLKISWKSVQAFLSSRVRKKIIIEKKKPKNNNKVFLWDGRP